MGYGYDEKCDCGKGWGSDDCYALGRGRGIYKSDGNRQGNGHDAHNARKTTGHF
jgi:hypothetical protein